MVKYLTATSAVLFAGFVMTVSAQTNTAPLRLVLECSAAPALTFRFALENISATPITTLIGDIYGNDDRKYVPDRLRLTMRRAGVPDTDYEYVAPSGELDLVRVQPWLITLPADASYSVALVPDHFARKPNGARAMLTTPADLQLHHSTAPLGGVNSTLPVWSGALSSEWISVPNDCLRKP